MQTKGMGLLNASPLHMRILTERGAPAWHPAPENVRAAGRKIVECANTRGVDTEAAALRFCLDHPYITSTFIGMSKPEEVDANIKALEITNDPEFLAEVERITGSALNTVWHSGRPENQD
jgi:L-galactose dehydrogenase